MASSTAISSKGFIDIFTLARSTPEPSAFTRAFTLKSITRFTGTSTFISAPLQSVRGQCAGKPGIFGSGRAPYGPTNFVSTRALLILQHMIGVAIEQLYAGRAQ